MNKRQLLRTSLAATAAACVTAPALAHSGPNVRWRMASSFPKSLDTIDVGTEVPAKQVAAITGGEFQISLHAAG